MPRHRASMWTASHNSETAQTASKRTQHQQTKLIVNILKTVILTLHNDLALHVLMCSPNLLAYIVSLNENYYLSEKANGCWPKSTYGASSFDKKSRRPSWPFAAIDHRIQAKIHSVFFWKMAPILVLKRSPAEFFASSRRHLVFFSLSSSSNEKLPHAMNIHQPLLLNRWSVL